MKSVSHSHNLPFQTKMVFTFILVLALALISKWVFFSFLMPGKTSTADTKFTGIKAQVNNVCLKEESKSLKGTSESNEEDQDWINFKAPEYCKCVSNRIVTFWVEKEKLSAVTKLNNEDLPEFIVTQLKDENTKNLIDFCLSKAQKVSGKKVTASATKN